MCTNREHNVQIGDILTSKDLITVIKGSSPQNNTPHKYVNMVAIGSLSDLPLKQYSLWWTQNIRDSINMEYTLNKGIYFTKAFYTDSEIKW